MAATFSTDPGFGYPTQSSGAGFLESNLGAIIPTGSANVDWTFGPGTGVAYNKSPLFLLPDGTYLPAHSGNQSAFLKSGCGRIEHSLGVTPAGNWYVHFYAAWGGMSSTVHRPPNFVVRVIGPDANFSQSFNIASTAFTSFSTSAIYLPTTAAAYYTLSFEVESCLGVDHNVVLLDTITINQTP